MNRLTILQFATYTTISTILVVAKYATLAIEDDRLVHPVCLAPLLTLATCLIFMLHLDPEQPNRGNLNRRLILYSMLLMQTLYWGVEIATPWLQPCPSRNFLHKTPSNPLSSQQNIAVSPNPHPTPDRNQDPKFTTRQTLALTFTISFYLITEIEYWVSFSSLLSDSPPPAPTSPNNKRSKRNPPRYWPDYHPPLFFYAYLEWYTRLHPSDTHLVPTIRGAPTIWSSINWHFTIWQLPTFLGWLPLSAMYWCVQSVVNPGVKDGNAALGCDAIFTYCNTWGGLINLGLLRPLRVINAAVVWYIGERCVRFVERRRNNGDTGDEEITMASGPVTARKSS